VNPIIKYLTKESDHIIPKELYEKTIQPLMHDPDVSKYLTNITNMSAQIINHTPEEAINAFRLLVISSLAVGYMYGAEGNKTAAEVAADVLKELNIKEQEEK
jgi:hypothetical protein